jgi:predicted nuclease with TOPRIM domain
MNEFEAVREQIHQIRSFLSPLDIKLDKLDQNIARCRITFEVKALELESTDIARHSERLRRIETLLNIPEGTEAAAPSPTHEDRQISPPKSRNLPPA